MLRYIDLKGIVASVATVVLGYVLLVGVMIIFQ